MLNVPGYAKNTYIFVKAYFTVQYACNCMHNDIKKITGVSHIIAEYKFFGAKSISNIKKWQKTISANWHEFKCEY